MAFSIYRYRKSRIPGYNVSDRKSRLKTTKYFFVLCPWFRASQVYIINVQRDATICSLYFILLQDHSTCFGCRPHSSSGVHETVVTANGTSHTTYAATSLPRGQLGHIGVRQLHDHMTCTSGSNYRCMYS